MIQTKTLEVKVELMEAINNAIEKELSKKFDDAIETIQAKKREMVAAALLDVQKQIDIQQSGDRTIFTIREIK